MKKQFVSELKKDESVNDFFVITNVSQRPYKNSSKGNLHIREYADKFTVHTDKVDPRTDPMGHLIHDAQEVLIGLAGAAISGAAIGSYIYKIKKNSPYRKQQAVIGGLAASLAAGYASYKISKKIKEKMD